MQIITLAIIKGGTGKSTTAAALAQAAKSARKKVLVIDLDPQGNLSFFTGADPNQQGSYQLLHGAAPLPLVQTTEQGIDVISGSPDLAAEKTTAGSINRLRDAIEPLKKRYDFIFIDTPPQMGELTFNALQASTGLIIPLETDNSSLQGLYQITDIAHELQKTNRKLKIKGVILTRYDNRPKLNRFIKDTITDKGKETGAPFLMAIRAGVAIREAQSLQQSLFDYAPNSKPAQDYKKLFSMIKGDK
jgi:chromosome partitioning protein